MKASLFFVLSLAAVGCGGVGGDDGGEVVSTDMAMTSVTVHKLVSGNYLVSGAAAGTDGCQVMPAGTGGFDGTSLALTNDGMGNVTLESFDSGVVGDTAPNMGTLSLTGHHTPTSGSCAYDYTVNSSVTVTADNTFTLSSTESQTNRAGCTTPSDVTCTSTYSMTLTKQ